jgi:hypothetical protein
MVLTGNLSIGGGAFACLRDLQVRNSTISGNVAVVGGGFYAAKGQISGSTISGNTATTFTPISPPSVGGGGISVGTAPMKVENSTISGNVVSNTRTGGYPGSHSAYGGGLFMPSDQASLVASTVAGNRVTAADPAAAAKGGGIATGTTTIYQPTVQNAIIAGNSAATGPDVFGKLNAAFDLIQNPADATLNETVAGSNILGQDPQLAPLASNGGPTQTLALSQSSPAVDKGSGSGLPADQRGLPRPLDFPQFPNSAAQGANGADIGAFELQPASGPFKFGKLKRKKRNGTAKQTIKLPTPDLGQVTVSGKGLKTKTIQAASASG